MVKTAESAVKTVEFDMSLYQRRSLSKDNNVNLYYRILQVDLTSPIRTLCCLHKYFIKNNVLARERVIKSALQIDTCYNAPKCN